MELRNHFQGARIRLAFRRLALLASEGSAALLVRELHLGVLWHLHLVKASPWPWLYFGLVESSLSHLETVLISERERIGGKLAAEVHFWGMFRLLEGRDP